MLAQKYDFIIYHCVGSQGHVREVVDGLNATYYHFISMLMTTVKLTVAPEHDTHMVTHNSTVDIDISVAR